MTLESIVLTLLSDINLRNYTQNLCFERQVLGYQHPVFLLPNVGELLFHSSDDYFEYVNVFISLYHCIILKVLLCIS